MSPRRPQLALGLLPRFGWGGKRAGAGPKPAGEEPGISHRRRLEVDAETPVHVTLRARDHVWNLRMRRCYAICAEALRGIADRGDFRVVHFSVQGNHVHLVVEADDGWALARGMRALSGRMAIRLNRLMGRDGPIFTDRYHAHVLRTPTEVARALAYVLGNFASHALWRGERVEAAWVDPYSSAAPVGPDGKPPPVRAASCWLLRVGADRAREPEAAYGPCTVRTRSGRRSARSGGARGGGFTTLPLARGPAARAAARGTRRRRPVDGAAPRWRAAAPGIERRWVRAGPRQAALHRRRWRPGDAAGCEAAGASARSGAPSRSELADNVRPFKLL